MKKIRKRVGELKPGEFIYSFGSRTDLDLVLEIEYRPYSKLYMVTVLTNNTTQKRFFNPLFSIDVLSCKPTKDKV
jgi:hypothetical protein